LSSVLEPEELGDFQLCKVGTAASFTVTVNGGNPTTVNLADGECQFIVQNVIATVSVTEVADPATVLNSISVQKFFVNQPSQTLPPITGTNTFTQTVNGDVGVIVTFNNVPAGLGRMTGGGFQLIAGDVKVTRGFTIHCDLTLSNNLEINWPNNQWHIDKPLTSATCIDDPAHDPKPPVAPFDTFIGVGVGELNGVAGSTVNFTFIDSGEPGGHNDMAAIQIRDASNNVVLDIPLSFLDKGNIQAHYDQPHGNKP